jgi:hypothetical protein
MDGGIASVIVLLFAVHNHLVLFHLNQQVDHVRSYNVVLLSVLYVTLHDILKEHFGFVVYDFYFEKLKIMRKLVFLVCTFRGPFLCHLHKFWKSIETKEFQSVYSVQSGDSFTVRIKVVGFVCHRINFDAK